MSPSSPLSGMEVGKVLPLDVREQQWITKLSVSGRAPRGLDLVIHVLTHNTRKTRNHMNLIASVMILGHFGDPPVVGQVVFFIILSSIFVCCHHLQKTTL